MIEHDKTNVNLDRIFEEMYNLINDARRLPLTDKIMLEESDVVGLMDDLKEAIPKEIKSATQILEEQKSIINQAYADAERIVANARAEAESIVERASAQAERMVQQEEVVKQAGAVAEEMRANAARYQEEVKSDADLYSEQVKQEALQYTEDMLAYISRSLQSALEGLEENRRNIAEEKQNISGRLPAEMESELE